MEKTPLHLAVRFGHRNIVAEICSRQQSLLWQTNLDRDTPLHVAAKAGHFSLVSFLVEKILSSSYRGIVNGRDRGTETLRMTNIGDNTVLHEALRNCHPRVAELLVKVDSKLACFVNSAGESPLYLAARDGMVDIVNLMLVTSCYSAHCGPGGLTALHAAVAQRHLDIMEVLLVAKPELIRETDHHGRTPLYYAASSGDHRTVRRLLEYDFSMAYMSDRDGQSPLHVAAHNGHTNVIEEIIQLCPDSGELLDLKGRNALHIAILSEKVNVVKYMLEIAELEGLINQADSDGNTPYHLAAMKRKTWIMRYLMWDERVDRRSKDNIEHQPINGEKVPQGTTQEETDCKTQSYRQMGRTLLMVAVLIATVTFAAAFTMPGGYNNNLGPNQGFALLLSSKQLRWFIISDSVAMTCSITAACIIFWGAVVAKETYVYYFASAMVLTYIAIISTAIAFTSGLIAVMPDQPFIYTMSYITGQVFHVNTFLFLLQVVRIFSLPEASKFLIYLLCKLKTKCMR
ncbi:ankyrin repeat family protein [Actinidia rufa]|uniref:Ankyrin repeat family protein n=1 Tax=Actinidia rufa TaxID=165716 RepID=A0A7J0G751_9ERIC|nr:ankyrin repeat family protein [Actinidia rufa]